MANFAVTICGDRSSTGGKYTGAAGASPPGRSCNYFSLLRPDSHMYLPLYVEPRDVVEAETLMDRFGKAAVLEAADRAEASRNIGNHLHYCRWRQIERLIIMLSVETTLGTVH